MGNERVRLAGREFDAITEEEVAAHVVEALSRGEGGRIVTPNVDILRLADSDRPIAAEVRSFLDDATLVVADGMPLVWASKLAGNPLPERVAGSSLIWTISQAIGDIAGSVYLLGGAPVPSAIEPEEGDDWLLMASAVGVAGRSADGAHRAAAELAGACPGLIIAGCAAPPFGFDADPDQYAPVLDAVIAARPDVCFVGLGFPRQERVITDLRDALPSTWFLGCGAAINFIAGEQQRAPIWMQRSGLEWAHRLAQEPRRLASRYLRHDAPYAVRLLAGAALRRP
ncbi:WecB/TagA/CpsF family glycosyltransferase [Hamadaea sp. NPDC051192]|uniref:WecB/TagA/CpsF family glycosyltransferase n=1 Tax=Hamadaea sp. NPDC051192 TaxID=3154940 RepID=UPI003432D721